MKRLQLFFVASVLFIAASLSASPVKANGQLDEVLSNMQREAKKIKTIYSRMTQQKRFKQLGGKPETYSGEIFFKHDGPGKDRVRINYDNGQQVSVVGNDITLYQPSINQAIVTTRSGAAAKNQEFDFIATPYKSVPELKSRYNIEHKGEEQVSGVATVVLELTPKGKSSVQKLVWWVSKTSWLPVKSQVTEANGDLSTFTLEGMQTNGVIGNNRFEIKLKPGTNKIRK